MSENRTKKMIPAKTLIGQTNPIKVAGGTHVVKIYYGNYCMFGDYDENDPTQSKSFNMDVKAYKSRLEKFFNTTDGKNYIIPTEDEDASAMMEVINIQREEKALREQRLEKMNSQQDNQDFSDEEEVEDDEYDEYDEETFNVENDTNDEYESEDDEDAYDDNDDEVEERKIRKTKKRKPERQKRDNPIFKILTVLFGLSTVALLAVNLGVIESPFQTSNKEDGIKVVVLNEDISNDTQITEDMLSSKVISTDEYESLKSFITIDNNGTMVRNNVQLWDGRSGLVGMYSTKAITAGDVIMNSDVSMLKNDGSTITMNIDGTEVTVPKTYLENGDSSVKLYAIISTKNVTTESNYGVFLGEMSLGKRNVSALLDSAGNNILEPSVNSGEVINQQSEPEYQEPYVEESNEASNGEEDYGNTSEDAIDENIALQG